MRELVLPEKVITKEPSQLEGESSNVHIQKRELGLKQYSIKHQTIISVGDRFFVKGWAMSFRKAILFLLLLFLIAPNIVLAKERRIALVIGNGAYKDSPLKNPVNDATDISAVLVELDFKVIIRTDATLRQMEESLDSFWSELKAGGVGLFYYAGHGLQVQGRNYLVPVDANVVVEQDVKYRCMDAGLVLGRMEAAENELNLVFLDACRNNPFARSFRSGSRGLARMDAPTGSLVAFSTAPGSVAADGRGRNGIFTAALLKRIKTPGVSVNDLLMTVRKDVVENTGKKQVPWESSSLMGRFYFASAVPVPTPEPSSMVTGLQEERQKLAQERTELERLKAEMAERKKVEAERKQIQAEKRIYASVSPPVKATNKVDMNGRFVKYENGIVYDKKTGLEWYAGPKQSLQWEKANYWAKSLWVGGGNWRLPTLSELRSLYQDGVGLHNMTPLLNASGGWFWSGKTSFLSDYRWYFSFITGEETVAKRPSNYAHRMLAVRARK
jgi:uncharacterized caspase-like protein